MDPLRTHVRKILRAMAADRAADDAKAKKLEATGRQIVTASDTAEGWKITDWRTRERLASGPGDYDDFCAAFDRLNPDGRWIRHEEVFEDDWSGLAVAPTTGIPPTLSQALIEWAETGSTPIAEVAEVAGWGSAEVERYLDRKA